MISATIHQAIHGYREGHRLLSSSLPLSADSARSMLVLSDMSGPAMQPGFDEYLTGYPLPGSELFVFAKTWYAPEMQRPGCVWTHSLLLSREQVSRASVSSLLSKFRRPQQGEVENTAAGPIEIDVVVDAVKLDGLADLAAASMLVSAVLGQPRPVIVAVDKAGQLELAFLRLWEELWPAARSRFSFCTGALMPRSVAGALMDLQAVPRAIPSSQFRKSAKSGFMIDLQTRGTEEPWVGHFLEAAKHGGGAFRTWLNAAAGADASRAAVSAFVPIFGAWHDDDSSARSVLGAVLAVKDLDPNIRGRLVDMVFNRADDEAGVSGRRELLVQISGRRDFELGPVVMVLEGQIRKIFEQSRTEGVALVLALLGIELTEIGERVLRAAVPLLVPSDLETFGDAQATYLPTIVGANYLLAASPVLWSRVGSRSAEILTRLGGMNLNDEERGTIIDAIISSARDVPADAIIRFGGDEAIFRGLTAITAGRIQLSWPWRSALTGRPDAVLEWLERLSSPSISDLELGSRLLTPKANKTRLTKVWSSCTANARVLIPRVAAFGLALALSEGSATSPLLAACFQSTYDAASSSCLEFDEWDWLREHAPSVSWYRDWDKCERLAMAIAHLFENQIASLETVFRTLQRRDAIRKVAAILYNDKSARSYLKSLWKTAEACPDIGNREQREAMLEDW